MLIFGVLLSLYWLSTSASVYACKFPPRWRDTWVINGYIDIFDYEITDTTIINTALDSKSRCLMSKGENRYLMAKTEKNNEQRVCYKCLIFTDRHVNVIQFKESNSRCNPSNTGEDLLERLCGEITNDNTLQTLVRKHAVPIACPEVLQRNLKFQYDKGEDICYSDSSVINPCASNKRLQMIFGSCQDPYYPREEAELQCLANWKVSGEDWLYVKYGNASYRCLKYDSTSNAIGMSPDATCIGISNIFDAPISISEWKEDTSIPKASELCSYPSWFTQREWSDLEAKNIYRYDLSTNELVVDNLIQDVVRYTETSQRLTCDQKLLDEVNEGRYIARVLKGCVRGYQCLIFRRKSDTVTELVIGALSNLPANACSPRRLFSTSAQRRILIDSNAAPVPCPIAGIYPLQKQKGRCSLSIELGCENPSAIVLKECDMIKSELLCLASWKDERSSQLIISKKSYPRSGNCYSYKVKNSDVVIEIDEQCNNHAPLILDSTYQHPPFTLPPAIKQCRGSRTPTKPDRGKEYQTGDEGKNSGYGLLANEIHLTLYAVVLLVMSNAL